MSFPTITDYEQFIYAIPERHRTVEFSTLVLIRLGRTVGELRGFLHFSNDIVLGVSEEIDFAHGLIKSYSYWVTQDDNRLYWYDSQPHPNDASLASTHPHYKHIPPDIKHHRIPAPGFSFSELNLPFLIREIEELLLAGEKH